MFANNQNITADTAGGEWYVECSPGAGYVGYSAPRLPTGVYPRLSGQQSQTGLGLVKISPSGGGSPLCALLSHPCLPVLPAVQVLYRAVQ